MRSMGSAESPTDAFRVAVSQGNYRLAYNAAKGIDLTLEQALDLVLLAPPEQYETFAARWIDKAIPETSPSLFEIRWMLERFEDAREGYEQQSREALRGFLRKRIP